MDVAQLSIYLPDDIAERLRLEAESTGKSLSKVVLENYLLPHHAKKQFGPEFWAHLQSLGPIPDDFVAPCRDEVFPEPDWSFDDIPA